MITDEMAVEIDLYESINECYWICFTNVNNGVVNALLFIWLTNHFIFMLGTTLHISERQ